MQQKMMLGVLLTLAIVLGVAVYWATEPDRHTTTQERFRIEATERGSHLFESYCVVCHGVTGTGIPGKNVGQTRLEEDAIRRLISRGSASGMPAFSLDEGGPLKNNQINDLIAFVVDWNETGQNSALAEKGVAGQTEPAALIEAAQQSPSPSPALQTSAPSAYSQPVVNATEVFANRCALCHGKNREGISGLGPALTPQRLAVRTDAEIQNTIENGRTGTLMPPFQGTLTPDEIAALLQLVRTAP